jgi:hypothetical protein
MQGCGDVVEIDGGTYAIDVPADDATHTKLLLVGTSRAAAVPAGGREGYLEEVIPDGSAANAYRGAALWTAHTHSGITLRTRANVRRCYVMRFTNAGLFVDGPGERAGGVADGFALEHSCVAEVGVGVAVVGEASGGTCRDLLLVSIAVQEGPAPLPPWDPTDFSGNGAHDASRLGCTWVGCSLSECSGPGYRAGGGTCAALFVGCHTEDNSPRAAVDSPAQLVGLNTDLLDDATGMYILSLALRNITFRSDLNRTTGGFEELSEPTAFWFGHDDDGPVRLRYRYRNGEWSFEHGTRAVLRFLVQRAEGGKGNWCDVNGHFMGATEGEQIFIGPAKARTDKHVRGGGDPTGTGVRGPQFRRGDQFWFQEGAAGAYAGWTVKTPGFRGVHWKPGTEYTDDGSTTLELGLVADLVEPTTSKVEEPDPGGRVFRCVGTKGDRKSGAVEPTWSLYARGDTFWDNNVMWCYVGDVPEYNRIGLIRAEGEDDLDAETQSLADGAHADVPIVVRGGRTRSIYMDGTNTGVTITGFAAPTALPGVTKPAEILVHRPFGMTFGTTPASSPGNQILNPPGGQNPIKAATFVYNTLSKKWVCTSFS